MDYVRAHQCLVRPVSYGNGQPFKLTYRHKSTWKEKQCNERDDSHEDGFLLHLLRHILHMVS